jgi:hypothetical protein
MMTLPVTLSSCLSVNSAGTFPEVILLAWKSLHCSVFPSGEQALQEVVGES